MCALSSPPVYDVLVLVEVHCRSSRWVPARATGRGRELHVDDAMLEMGIDVRRYDTIHSSFLYRVRDFVDVVYAAVNAPFSLVRDLASWFMIFFSTHKKT